MGKNKNPPDYLREEAVKNIKSRFQMIKPLRLWLAHLAVFILVVFTIYNFMRVPPFFIFTPDEGVVGISSLTGIAGLI